MTKDFSIKTFLRNVTPQLLHEFFKKQPLLRDFDWTLKDEEFVETLYQTLEQLPKEPKGFINDTFEIIHEFSNEEGILSLFDIIRERDPENAEKTVEQFIKNKGHHNQVLWLSVNHPELIEWALRLERMQDMKFKHECMVGKDLKIRIETEIINSFKELLQKFYKNQKRGNNCHIDPYIRESPKRYCFFAYPEDHAKRDLKYKKGNLTTALRWPVLEHVFIYEPQTGKLRISAGKTRNVQPMQEAFCKAVLGLPGIPDGSTKVYDLSPLMKPEFKFTDHPEHQVESISLRMLKAVVSKDSKNRKLTCEGEPENGGTELLQTMLNKAAIGIGVNPDRLRIISAKIAIVFQAPNGGRKPSVTFILSYPGGSTLEDKPHHHIANQYLEEWKLANLLLEKEDEVA